MRNEDDTGFTCALKVIIATAFIIWLVGLTVMGSK